MARITSPIRWLGGKSYIVPWVLSKFPSDHTVYVEPFGGGASVLLSKPPVEKEVYCDIDVRLVQFFREIRDNHEEFMAQVAMTPYSRQLRTRCFKKKDPLSFFINSQQSFGGMVDKTSWGLVSGSSSHGVASVVHHYWRVLKALPRFSERLRDIVINRCSWETSLSKYDSPSTLFYLDPPYIPQTRRDGSYEHEMTLEDHQRFIATLQLLEGSVVLSGYANPVYSELEKVGWKRYDKTTSCMVVARTAATGLKGRGAVKKEQKRVESLWLNPAAQRRRRG